MIEKYVFIFLTTATFTAQAMEKQFDMTAIVALAKTDQTHQPFIEACFAQQLLGEKPRRDLLFIQLQSSVNNEMRASSYPEAVKQCLLTHLTLAYYKKEFAHHQQGLATCEQEIKKLCDTLINKK